MGCNSTIIQRRALLPGALVAAAALSSVFAATAGAQTHHRTLWVSANGTSSKACTHHAPCKTITRAVNEARKGDTVMVERGTYHEDVTVNKDIRLVGVGKPVVEAKGLDNGIVVTGTAAKGAVVRGFTAKDATFEGLLARDVTGVTIRDNVVMGNDQGATSANPTGSCAVEMNVPGDCGEGMHLTGVTHSTIAGNTSTDNSGGMLVSDETGPTAFNKITDNKVTNNLTDCGITMAGHNPRALTLGGTPDAPTVMGTAPKLGGVYKNTVTGNTVSGNGTRGAGGGVLLAAAPPGAAVYDNTVKGNTARGNGLGGITLHSHSAGQDLNGNTIVDNTVANNGLNGGVSGAPGDSDAGVTQTVDITVWSAVTPLHGVTVRGNHVSKAHFGVWTQNAPTVKASQNSATSSVAVPFFAKQP